MNREEMLSSKIFHYLSKNIKQKHLDDMATEITALALALMPEVMSEEDLQRKIQEICNENFDELRGENSDIVLSRQIAKALTIAKPQVMDLDRVLPQKKDIKPDDWKDLNMSFGDVIYAENAIIDDCRKALANMPKVMTKESIENILWTRFPELQELVKPIAEALASKLIGRDE